MSYNILYKREAKRNLERFEQPERLRIIAKISTLSEIPRPHGVKKVQGADNLYRIRVGNCRVIYEIQDDRLIIIIIRIRHRREVY